MTGLIFSKKCLFWLSKTRTFVSLHSAPKVFKNIRLNIKYLSKRLNSRCVCILLFQCITHGSKRLSDCHSLNVHHDVFMSNVLCSGANWFSDITSNSRGGTRSDHYSQTLWRLGTAVKQLTSASVEAIISCLSVSPSVSPSVSKKFLKLLFKCRSMIKQSSKSVTNKLLNSKNTGVPTK